MLTKSLLSCASAVLFLVTGCVSSSVFAADAQHKNKHKHHRHLHRLSFNPSQINLLSRSALVIDELDHHVVFSKNPDPIQPIASITKLMTAVVVLESQQNLDEKLTVTKDDVDMLRFSSSHLRVGAQASRLEFLKMALIASENRAASALGRSYPGGLSAFVLKMNEEAKKLGMVHSHFADSSGLNGKNVSSAEDLVRLVEKARTIPLIHKITTTAEVTLPVGYHHQMVRFKNTNPLVAKQDWEIGLSKTGYINESGQCLVMEATITGRPMVIVLLDSHGHQARINDARRVRQWLEYRSRTTNTTVGQL
ncbi:D-alanyl-D-alanine endopeptidase precursor [Ferrovum sp. JA12]|uniref:serine hydrolase n=1 Tax=Ferrovum sp. JA12 TaxID=1356299 RepID=UPI0007024BA5|nr:serine hydrolase [Ferrovum sp. JA12]KRH78101.1 D-alanyl-D-alanine endopeptidase precursor [Ferrovum sp. JA12]HQT81214.1 serine hydrolase [Ferrovaceae bacterium]HQU05667.1 serine hydrolase [Ferrovaceae bacterium]